MAFTIPNVADAGDPKQAEPDSRDFDVLVAGIAGNGVLSGCQVTAQGSPNMTVAVAAGVVVIAGFAVAVTSGNVTITTADSSNPRFDLICVSNAGVKSAAAGTPAAAPVFPTIPANNVCIAAVLVPTSDTTISTDQIIDKSVVVPPTNTNAIGLSMALGY